MSNLAIQLSAQADHNDSVGGQLAPVSRATIEFFDNFQPASDPSTISLSSVDGLSFKDFSNAAPTGSTEFRCISQACVSDVSVFESASNLANVDPALLANNYSTDIPDPMNEQISFESLNIDLLNAMPQLKHALDGELDYSQLSQLISDIQAQVLELNGLGHELFGTLSNEVNNRVQEFSEVDSNALLTSMQVDSSLFAQPNLSINTHSLAFEATLDGLFTTPEAFPLTLDFSNPNSIQEASELFASTGATSSISSSAGDADNDIGLVDGSSSSPDLA